MKKIISVLIVVVMLVSAVAAMIPASAASLAYVPDWLDLKNRTKYIAYYTDGTEYTLADFWNKYIVTRESNLFSPNTRTDGAPACAYISTIQFAINSNTKYQYDVKVKSNSSSIVANNFGGVVFAISSDKVVYSAYGGFDNTNAFGAAPNNEHSFIITIHGDYNDREPYVGDEYMSDPKYFKELELDSEGFASLRFVYEGLKVTVFAKDKTGNFVQIGEPVTLASGSKLAFGAFNRNGSTNNNRTVSLKDAKIMGLNDDAVSAMQATGEDFGDDRGIAELEALVEQVKTEYNKVDYTEESWEALEVALRQAELVIADLEATEDDVTLAKEDLEMAIFGLEIAPIDTAELEQLIKDVKSLEKNKDKYNITSYNFLMKVTGEAEAFLETIEGNEDVTQSDVVAVIDDIKSKIANLKLADGTPAPFEPETGDTETEAPETQAPSSVDKTALKTEIDACKLLKKEEWQGDVNAWDAFEQELAKADALYVKADALKADVDAMVTSLQTKKAALKQTGTANKTALKAEIDACKLLKKEDWQSDVAAWSAFEQELVKADALYIKADASQADVDAMVASLQTKKAALKKTVVKTALKAEIDLCKKYNKDAWQGNADAWTAFEQELTKADALYAKADATQEEVDAMVTSLQTKKNALKVTIRNRDALAKLIEFCKLVKKAEWQGDVAAWTAFEQELAKAETIYNNPDAIQTDINGVIDSLQAVKAKLKKTPTDKTALKAIIDACKLCVKDAWQGDVAAWNAFAQELVNAEALYANASVPQATVDAMVTLLEAKKAALKATPQATETESSTESESGTAATDAPKTYQKSGCGGAIVTTSVIVGLVTTLGAALIIKKKD